MPEGTPPPADAVRALEPDVRRLWTGRRLPAASGVLGPADGPLVRQFMGTFSVADLPELVAHRAVVADVDARRLLLAGRGVTGTLRHEVRAGESPSDRIAPLLATLGVWTGGPGVPPWDDADRRPGIQAIVSRLAQRGVLVARDGPLRLCLTCRAPRSPQGIVYQKEVGDTLLVRFPIVGTDPPIDALVWVDAAWRLLGTSALLVHPDIPYSVVEYRRKGASVLLLASHGSLARLKSWLPDVELTVREERLGKEWAGRAYMYPLRHEFPIGGQLDPPAGTIQADPEVGDSGTGIVPLVPGHGPTDAEIATRLGIAGWPLLTPGGTLDPMLMHKYAGLDVETANEFVARDLTESGAVVARLRVVRGVPYCAVCGHRMVWSPGRAWCLEPTHLPPEQRDRYARLLAQERPLAQLEVARWPVSETGGAKETGAVTLLECARCERLDAPDGPTDCPCGGTRRKVARRLLPTFAGILAAWARNDPIAPADVVRIYLGERRRVPALVHHLTAMTGLDAQVAELGLTRLPTVSRVDVAALLDRFGADAVRSAFVRTTGEPGAPANFEVRCAQEADRLATFARRAVLIATLCDPELLRDSRGPPDPAGRDLEVEDRAILARWARLHLHVLAAYDRWQPEAAHRLLYRFLERDLLEYLALTGPRLDFAGTPATKRGALRTLLYLLRASSVALAPIAPFTAESVHRRLTGVPRSLFEGNDLAADRSLADDALSDAWARWQRVIEAADRFRRARRLAPRAPLPNVALVLPDEDAAGRLRADRVTLERLAGIAKLEVTSPQVPWTARQRRLVPVESEIQRAYPAFAAQIIHLLERTPPRRPTDPMAKELTVAVHGVPRTITPEMVQYVDTLPEGFVPTPFALGEMYVQAPATSARAPPPLSPDAFWLVRRVRRRLATANRGPHIALVSAADPLASELSEKAGAIAGFLGLSELRVLSAAPAEVPRPAISGRTRTGARWTVALPGVGTRRRSSKLRLPRSDRRRAPPARETVAGDETDFADEEVIARERAIVQLGESLDELLGAPLLGPAKVAVAWDAGLTSVQQFQEAPYDRVAGLTGFGRPIADRLWRRLGRPLPSPPARARTRAVGAVRERRAPLPTEPRAPSPAAAAETPPPEPAVPGEAEPLFLPPVASTDRTVVEAPAERTSGEAQEPVRDEELALSSAADLLPVPTGPPADEAADPEPDGPPVGSVAEVGTGETGPAFFSDPPPTPAPHPPPSPPPPGPAENSEGRAVEGTPTEFPPPLDLAAPPESAAPEPASADGEPIPLPESSEPAPPFPGEPGPTTPSENPDAHPTEELAAVPPVVSPEPAAAVALPAMPEPPPSELVAAQSEELLAPTPAEPAPGPASPATPEPLLSEPEPPNSVELPSAASPDLAPEVVLPAVPESPAAEPTPSPAVEGADAASPTTPPTPEASGEIVVEGSVPTPDGRVESIVGAGPTPEAPSPPNDPPPEIPELLPPTPESAPVAPPEVDRAPDEWAIPGPEGAPAPGAPAELELPLGAPPVATTEEPAAPVDATRVGDEPPAAVPATGGPIAEPPAEVEETPPERLDVPVAEPPVLPPAELRDPATPPSAPPAPEVSGELPAAPPEERAAPELGVPPPVPGIDVPVAVPEIPPPAIVLPEPAAPPAPEPAAPLPPPPSGVEFDESSALFVALQPFLDATAAGHRGIAIVREPPERIRVHVGSRPVDVYWLTNLDRRNTLKPTDLGGLLQQIVRFLDEGRVTAFFLEGVEYLVGVHGIGRVTAFLQELDRAARERSARVWVHVTPSLLSEADLEHLLASAAPPAEPPA